MQDLTFSLQLISSPVYFTSWSPRYYKAFDSMYRSTIHFELIFVSGITFSTPLHDYPVILVAFIEKKFLSSYFDIFIKNQWKAREMVRHFPSIQLIVGKDPWIQRWVQFPALHMAPQVDKISTDHFCVGLILYRSFIPLNCNYSSLHCRSTFSIAW